MTVAASNLSQRFPRKRAFITGAASGLGLACAEILAREGWQLLLNDNDAARLALVADSFRRDGALVTTLEGDVRDGAGIERRRIDIEAGARLEQIHHQQADQQRHARYDFEVQDRLDADAADLLHVGDTGDAHHHGQKNDRRDQHLNQADKAVAQRLERDASIGCVMADGAADDDRQQYPQVQALGRAAMGRGVGLR